MIAQVLPTAQLTVVPTIQNDDAAYEADLDRELLLDDLSNLAQTIRDVLAANDRGMDIETSLGNIINSVKSIAVCQGITKEISEQNDRHLKQIGMKQLLVPLAN